MITAPYVALHLLQLATWKTDRHTDRLWCTQHVDMRWGCHADTHWHTHTHKHLNVHKSSTVILVLTQTTGCIPALNPFLAPITQKAPTPTASKKNNQKSSSVRPAAADVPRMHVKRSLTGYVVQAVTQQHNEWLSSIMSDSAAYEAHSANIVSRKWSKLVISL